METTGIVLNIWVKILFSDYMQTVFMQKGRPWIIIAVLLMEQYALFVNHTKCRVVRWA